MDRKKHDLESEVRKFLEGKKSEEGQKLFADSALLIPFLQWKLGNIPIRQSFNWLPLEQAWISLLKLV